MLALIAGMAWSMPGCSARDEAELAIKAASVQLGSLGPGGNNVPAPEHRKKTYSGVIASLKGHLDGGLPGQNAAANLLTAKAEAGLAEIPAAEAGAGEARALEDIALLRELQNVWTEQTARAAALEQYDPKQELAEADTQIKQKEVALAQAQADKAKNDNAVKALEAKSEAALAKAQAERNAAAELIQKAGEMSAVQRAEVVKQAAARRRQADAFDMDGSVLKAEAAKERPRSDEIQREIERLTTQRTLLVQSKEQAGARHRQNQSLAAEARAAAAATAQSIGRKVADLAAMRADAPTKKFEEANGLLRSALGKVAKGMKDVPAETRASASMARANMLQAAASLHWNRARGAQAYADLLAVLSSKDGAALPEQAMYQADATAAAEAAKKSLEEMQQVFGDVKSALESGGAPKELKEKLSALGTDVYEKIQKGERLAPAQLVASIPAPAGGAATGSGSAEDAPIRQMLERLLAAGKDQNIPAALALVHTSDATTKKLFDALPDVYNKSIAFNAACKAKFGKGFFELPEVASSPVFSQVGAMVKSGQLVNVPGGSLGSVTAADFDIAVNGEHATATPKGGGATSAVPLVKADGAWKIEVPAMPPAAAAQVSGVIEVMPQISGLLGRLTADLNAGKFANPTELLNTMTLTAAPLMMKLQGGGPGRPGGGGGGGG